MKKTKRLSKILIMGIIILQFSGMVVKAGILPAEYYDDESNVTVDFYKKEPVKNLTRVDARNAIALDGSTGEILFYQKADEIVPMASTTKILTALITINYGKLDEKVIISKTAAGIRGSKVGYKAGEEIALKELLFGLMFRSGNDAAIAIAEHIGGSIEGFANIMNDFARSLGLINSHFESPHGLDSQKHYSSAYDLALLTSKSMKNDLFREVVSSKEIRKEKYNFTRDYININKILHLIPNANGVKTGYTGQAGKCLVSSINHEGRDIIIVVLNCTDRWNQTAKIYNYISENYDFKHVSTKSIIENSSFARLGTVIRDDEIAFGYKDDANKDIQVFSGGLDVKKGDVIGKITFEDGEMQSTKYPIVSDKDLSIELLKELIEQ